MGKQYWVKLWDDGWVSRTGELNRTWDTTADYYLIFWFLRGFVYASEASEITFIFIFLQCFYHEIYDIAGVRFYGFSFSFFLCFSVSSLLSLFWDINYTCHSLATFWLNDFWYLSSNCVIKWHKKRHQNK